MPAEVDDVRDVGWATMRLPEQDPVAASLAERAAAERRASRDRLQVPADFAFEDRVEDSGISFVHRVVEDGGKFYRMSHWDHGSGLAAADVDGDGATDLYFVNQIGANELWRNTGDGRFENWTQRSGTGMSDRVAVSAAFADVDNDGDPDLYVTTVRGGTALFENLGDGRFRDRTDEAGVGYTGHPSAPVFFDYDLDGRLDLVLTAVGSYTTQERGAGGYFIGRADAFAGHLHPSRSERTRIYRNAGDWRFEDVSDELGFRDEGWTGDVLVLDPDRDRYPDLYVLNMQGDDHYWENRAGERFVERGAVVFPRTSWGSMGAVQLDADGDGRIDFFVTDMHSDMSEEVGPEREHLKSRMQWPDSHLQGGANNLFGNSLFLGLGEGRFAEASDRLGVETYWPWGVSAGDLNADGWEDLFVTSSMNFPWRYQVNKLLLNNGGGFVAAEFLLGVEPRRDGRTYAPWFELDCVGGPAAEREHVLCQRGPDRRWRVEGTLGSRSSVIVDLDGDGDQDIVTADFNSAPQVLHSDLAQRSTPSWIAVELTGVESNRDGLGARIELDAGGRTQVRYLNGKSGYMSQSSLPAYFGLDGATEVEELRVLWPSGCRQALDAEPRRVVTVVEDCGEAASAR
ncbi:MAG: CRTAC1 family protein [Thermoanaerobaculia bacterium]|nr:CRTAC1 family protein [Thermoanaerobaculia bacterium]